MFNLRHCATGEGLEPCFSGFWFDAAEAVRKQRGQSLSSRKICSITFQFPWRHIWNRRAARLSAVWRCYAPSTRNRRDSTSCFWRSSRRNISERSVVIVKNSRAWSRSFITGSAAAYSQNCYSLTWILFYQAWSVSFFARILAVNWIPVSNYGLLFGRTGPRKLSNSTVFASNSLQRVVEYQTSSPAWVSAHAPQNSN